MNQGDDSVKGKSKGTGFQNEGGCISVNLSIYGGFFKVSESPGDTVPLNSRPVPLNLGII